MSKLILKKVQERGVKKPNGDEYIALFIDKDNDSKLTYKDSDGNISFVGDGVYILPTASTTVLGGVKVGSNLTMSDGVLTADKQTWDDILNKPNTFTPSVHTHIKNEITDFPTNLSQFNNDSNYITHSALNEYLPLSGGTMSGGIIAISFTKNGTTKDDILLGDGTTIATSSFAPSTIIPFYGTYDVIYALYSTSKLTVGRQYHITDYRYISTLNNITIGTDDSGYPSDFMELVLTATSNHSFDKRVSAVPQPNSNKYYLTQLDKFIIEYDINHKISNDKGVITFMKDCCGNEMPFDIYNQRQYITDDIKTTYSVGTNYPYLFGGITQWNSTTNDSKTKFYNNKIENVNCFYGNYLSYNSKFYNNNFGKTITFGYNILSGNNSTIQSCILSGYQSYIQYCVLSGEDSFIGYCTLSGNNSYIGYCTLSGNNSYISYNILSGNNSYISYCTLNGQDSCIDSCTLSGMDSFISYCTLSGNNSYISYCTLSGNQSYIQYCVLSGVESTIHYCTLSGTMSNIQYCTLSGTMSIINYCTLNGDHSAIQSCVLSGKRSIIQSCTLSGYQSYIQYCVLSGYYSIIHYCTLSGVESTIHYCTLSGTMSNIQYCTLSGNNSYISYCPLNGEDSISVISYHSSFIEYSFDYSDIMIIGNNYNYYITKSQLDSIKITDTITEIRYLSNTVAVIKSINNTTGVESNTIATIPNKPSIGVAVLNITATTLKVSKNVLNGTEFVLEQGYEYKLSTDTTYTTITYDTITGLTANTSYDVRAYAKTASGTYYSQVITIKTLTA